MFFLFYVFLGYDSDDEYDDDSVRKNKFKESRWTTSGTYGKVPLDAEDSILDSIFSQKHFSPSLVTGMINRQSSQSESSLNRQVTSPSSNSSGGSARVDQSSSSSSGFHSGYSPASRSSENVQYGRQDSGPHGGGGQGPVPRYGNHVTRSQSSHAQLSGVGPGARQAEDEAARDRSRPNAYLDARTTGGKVGNFNCSECIMAPPAMVFQKSFQLTIQLTKCPSNTAPRPNNSAVFADAIVVTA